MTRRKVLLYLALGISLLLLGSGCVRFQGGSRSEPAIKQFSLQYPSPSHPGSPTLDATLKIERFSIARSFGSPIMVFGSDKYKRDVYHYERWRTNPADMVTDDLVRDFQNSGVFKAVFSYHDTDDAVFVLKGYISEFLQEDTDAGATAKLAVNATLLDMREKGDKGIVFQKSYSFNQPSEKGAEGFSEAMSRAVEDLSKTLGTEVYSSVKERIGE